MSTAILALCAVFSLAFAPSVDARTELQEPEGSSCLEGYVYVRVGASNYGPTSPVCAWNTDCAGATFIGPASVTAGVVQLRYYANLPRHAHPDVACYA
jgi:hypothetical protein